MTEDFFEWGHIDRGLIHRGLFDWGHIDRERRRLTNKGPTYLGLTE